MKKLLLLTCFAIVGNALCAQNSQYLLDSIKFDYPNFNILGKYFYNDNEDLIRLESHTEYTIFSYPESQVQERFVYFLPDSFLLRREYNTYNSNNQLVSGYKYLLDDGQLLLGVIDSSYYTSQGQLKKFVRYFVEDNNLTINIINDKEYDNLGNLILDEFARYNEAGDVTLDDKREWIFNSDNLLEKKMRTTMSGGTTDTTIYTYIDGELLSENFRAFDIIDLKYLTCHTNEYIYEEGVENRSFYYSSDCIEYSLVTTSDKFNEDKQRVFSSFDSILNYNLNNTLFSLEYEIEEFSDSDTKVFHQIHAADIENGMLEKESFRNYWYHKNSKWVGIEESEFDLLPTISANPNPSPSGSMMNIQITGSDVDYIRIYNVQGNLVHTSKSHGQDRMNFLSPNESGMYFIQFFDENHQITAKPAKFIVR